MGKEKKQTHRARKRAKESRDDTEASSSTAPMRSSLMYCGRATEDVAADENEKTTQQGGQWSVVDSSEDEEMAADERKAHTPEIRGRRK
ncbi:MAG: hypothetical protein SGPRY_009379, partial [Prymnesium sp.]